MCILTLFLARRLSRFPIVRRYIAIVKLPRARMRGVHICTAISNIYMHQLPISWFFVAVVVVGGPKRVRPKPRSQCEDFKIDPDP